MAISGEHERIWDKMVCHSSQETKTKTKNKKTHKNKKNKNKKN